MYIFCEINLHISFYYDSVCIHILILRFDDAQFIQHCTYDVMSSVCELKAIARKLYSFNTRRTLNNISSLLVNFFFRSSFLWSISFLNISCFSLWNKKQEEDEKNFKMWAFFTWVNGGLFSRIVSIKDQNNSFTIISHLDTVRGLKLRKGQMFSLPVVSS